MTTNPAKIGTRIMNSTDVQNPRRKLDVFGSVLACAKSAQARVSEALLLALRTVSLFCH